MSEWTSKYAIKCDLSVAQSRRVPGSLRTGPLYAGEKPPPIKITEETEEEYFDHCSGDAVTKPNYELIKQMLDMVRDKNISDDEDENIGVISKLNAESAEFIPNIISTPLPSKPVVKKRQKINIALESILQAIEDKKKVSDANETMKLLKPDDFIVNEKETQDNIPQEVVDKVNGWLQTQNAVITTKLPKKKPPKLDLEATNMFKKKSAKDKVKIIEKNSITKSNETNGNFQPGPLAQEYYKKFLERSKLREDVKVDIWSKAEEKMKEIDEKRKLDTVEKLSLSNTSTCTSAQDLDNNDKCDPEILNESALKTIALPQNRHELLDGEECVVCTVLTKQN